MPVQETTSQALSTLTDAERKQLQDDREKMGGGQLPSIPLIRLANKDMTQAPEGEYFVETRKGKDEEPDIRRIGANPEVTILYKTNTYSYATKDDGLIAYTTDIHAFGTLDHVTLFKKKGDRYVIDFDGVWPDFRKHIETKYTTIDPVTEKKKKLLKFKTVLYVLFEGKPHKMFVTNASSAGIDENGNPSFDSPQPNSLQAFTDRCWSNRRALYEFSVTLGSAYVESSKPYYIMRFLDPKELSENDLAIALRASRAAEKSIYMIDDARKRNTMTEQDGENTHVPTVKYEPSISLTELPF